MSGLVTIARPYAKAAFEFALEQNQLEAWYDCLRAASWIAIDSGVHKLLTNPNVSIEEILDMFFSILEKQLDANRKNFLKLLAGYKHLTKLPEIAKLYAYFFAEYQKVMDAHVVSAFELTEKQKTDISEALKKRLQHKVKLHCTVDEDILGGAIIRAGDLVIDGSGRSKVARLAEHIRGSVVCN